MPRARLGLFGGSFDPPHVGHLILASEAVHQMRLSRLLWVLTPTNPLKNDQFITAAQHRLAMLELAIANDPAFELSRLELDRPGPQFTLDTLHLAARQEPAAELILILGGDSLHDLPAWHRPKEIISACSQIGVMRRPADSVDLSGLELLLPGISAKIFFIDAPLLEIAARDIRQRINAGEPFRYYLLPSVYEYIQKHDLYRQSKIVNRKS